VWKISDLGFPTLIKGISNGASPEASVSQSYRAPELFEPKSRHSQWSDIWALGCIFYEMLVLKKAFGSEIDILRYSKSRTKLRISYSLPVHEEAKGFVSQVLHKMLAKEPKSRPTAVILRETFGSYDGDSSTESPREVAVIDDACSAHSDYGKRLGSLLIDNFSGIGNLWRYNKFSSSAPVPM
jgi:serine/threonine protein kinase